jgi:alkylation response protein AidB-like acyl-CoA dehydrogenase
MRRDIDSGSGRSLVQRNRSLPEVRANLPDSEFRRQLRAWLSQVVPETWRDPSQRLRAADSKWWLRTQFEAGWRAPSWPREYGGLGLSIRKQIIYQQEMERSGVARTLDHGVRMVGPILIRYGTAEQRAIYLPPILNGEHQWCQGYSEPGAGSDLANLKMSAERRGDEFVLNGQKIWTTQAADSTHMYVLGRTSRLARKQEGITLFVTEMNGPGMRIRPIRNLTGEDEFYEVFFDDFVIPAVNVIGSVDDGWRIAKALLGFERFSQGSPLLARHALRIALRIASALHLYEDTRYADRIAALTCDLHDATALYEDVCEAVERGDELQDEYSMAKLVSAELFQRVSDCLIDMVGEPAESRGAGLPEELRAAAERLFLIARPVTIFGGTSEVQRNILSKSLLR